ncbi:MAG: adenine phosphoribosyltransferase [Myxococcota bacterium]
MPDVSRLRSLIRDIPDFPKPGILFRDLTPLLSDPAGLRESVAALAEPYRGDPIDRVLGIESRGFVLGAPVAIELGVGFVPVRKPGKLPHRTLEVSYDLEYGSDTVEMHVDAVHPGERVLIVDDLIATGGTAAASVELVRKAGAEVVSCAFLMELTALCGREKLGVDHIHSVLDY